MNVPSITSLETHIAELAKDSDGLLDTAQGCRASNFTSLECVPQLYLLFPSTSANDMAAVLVEVWACELSKANLTTGLQSCLTSDGSRAYTDVEITTAIAAAMSLTFWDVAHVPTEYGGVPNLELKMIGLSQGSLTGITPAEAARFIIISCLPGDYSPTPGSLIAAVKSAYAIDVATLAADPAADYRSTHHCWISKDLANYSPSSPVPYQQLLCFESTGADAPGNIPGIFAGIQEYIPDPPAIPNTGPTIVSALVSTGSAGADKSQVLTALFNGCWELMTGGSGYNMTCFRIDIYNAGWQQDMVTLFDQLKQQHGA